MSINFNLPTELQQLVNPQQAYHYRIIPYAKDGKVITFKTDHADITALKSELIIVLGLLVELISDSPENISRYLSTNYRKSSSDKVSAIHYSNDFLEKILISAKETGSSDIHFEAYEMKARVRFRLDGKLKEQFTISLDEYPVIVNKIKIRAQLDISEKRLPQDGRITISTEYEDFDIRVSVLPTLHSEKVVLRILSKDTSHVQLESVGFTEDELKTYLENIKKPNMPNKAKKILIKLTSPSLLLTSERPQETSLRSVLAQYHLWWQPLFHLV